MLNNKGFTLIELLVMMVVLGILMAITVPNISGILSNQKENVLAEDVGKMVDTVKIKMSNKNEIPPLNNNECIKFTLNLLNDNDEFKNGPNGEPYDFDNSFVIVKRNNKKYEYYVKLVEKGDYGVNTINYDNFVKDPHSKIGKINGAGASHGCTSFR